MRRLTSSIALIAFVALLLPAASAHAKASVDLGYRLEEAFSTAARFVRVDRHCKIVDQDAEAAFVMFECPLDEGKVSRGALEIFRVITHGKESVRIQVTLSDEPHGAELRLVELLERKLREERGSPVTPTQAPAPPPDASPKKDAP